MSSRELAKSTRQEKWTAHAAISIVSPGKDEEDEKNQDRLMLLETDDSGNARCRIAIVCDGVTSSPNGTAAAQYVSDQAQTLFQADGLQRAAEALQEMRQALLDKPLKTEEGQSALLRSMFEEIVQQKYQQSYQTTFVAVCLKRDETTSAGMISIKAIGCGDSALFIFRENGELRYNNINLADEVDHFRHGSSFTAVLPDCYDEETGNLLFDFEEYPEDVQLLLCSDGLYDGFTNFKEIHDWLNEHRAELSDAEQRDGCLSELHRNLNLKKGDDDISFIWMYPNKSQSAAAEEVVATVREEEQRHAENSKRPLGWTVYRLVCRIKSWMHGQFIIRCL